MTTPSVFVYGTLMPGHQRWPWLAPYVQSHHPDEIRGRLYDTQMGYPAALLDEDGRIPGISCTLDPLLADEAWSMLDDIEGRLYERRTTTTRRGRAVSTYVWIGEREHLVPIAGAWVDDRVDP